MGNLEKIDKMKLFGLFLASAVNSANCPNGGQPHFLRYKCDFGAGFGDISGALEIFQCRNTVHFTGTLRSNALTDGFHAFHVHEKNDVTTCSTTGGHFQSTPGEIHGYPDQHRLDQLEPESVAAPLKSMDFIILENAKLSFK